MLKNVLAAADEPAISTARKFSFCYRWDIYRTAARSRYAGQLALTFPLLACRLYDDKLSDLAENSNACNLVERGRSLRDVARAITLPMALHRVKPGAVSYVSAFVEVNPRLVEAYLPATTQGQRVWLRAIKVAEECAGEEYAAWVARKIGDLNPRTIAEATAWVGNTGDWVVASSPTALPVIPFRENQVQGINPLGHGHRVGQESISRPFQLDMSFHTVERLSDE